MDRYLGLVKGSRGEVTRLGTPESGLSAKAQGWTETKYCVDGYEFDDLESSQAGDGEFAPFQIFDIQGQKYLLGTFSTRADAERFCDAVKALSRLLIETMVDTSEQCDLPELQKEAHAALRALKGEA